MWTKRDKALYREDGLCIRRRCDDGEFSLEFGFLPGSSHHLSVAEVLSFVLPVPPLGRYDENVRPGADGFIHLRKTNGMDALAAWIDAKIPLRSLARATERALNAHFDDVLMKHHPYADEDDFAALNSNGTEEP
jgi:hypothetical protein